jgi:protein Tex
MDGVEKISDLKPGMMLEGVVTNVAAFGAFVDVGVHQDGLVHISALSSTFVKDPRDVVKPGDIVKVKVLEVDIPRKRISLTMRMSDPAEPRAGGRSDDNRNASQKSRQQMSSKPAAAPAASGALADALRRAGLSNAPGGKTRR